MILKLLLTNQIILMIFIKILKNTEYNPNKTCQILIVFDMIPDMLVIKNLSNSGWIIY